MRNPTVCRSIFDSPATELHRCPGKVWFRIGQDGVESTEADVMIIAIYDLQGNRHKTVTSGINIVRYSDGSIRKIMVR